MVRATFCDCGVRRVPRVLETAFHEIDVQRIDIGEPRDTVPLVISDKARFPGSLRARPAGYPRWQPAAHRALSFSPTAAERRVDIAEKARPGGEATGSASPSSERGKQGGAPHVFVSEILWNPVMAHS